MVVCDNQFKCKDLIQWQMMIPNFTATIYSGFYYTLSSAKGLFKLSVAHDDTLSHFASFEAVA